MGKGGGARMALRPMLQLLLAVRCLLDDLGYDLRLRDIDRMAAGNLENRCGRTLGHHPLRRGRDHVVFRGNQAR